MNGLKIYPQEYIICKNIVNFCEFRGIQLDQEYKFKTGDVVTIPEEPIIFNGSQDDKKYQIIYIPSDSEYYKKNNFARIVNINCHVIVITHFDKKISTSAKNIDVYPASAFMKNHAKKWKILGQSMTVETDENTLYYTKLHSISSASKYSKLALGSIEQIWGGYKLGQVINITCPTIASSGLMTTTRYVGSGIIVDDEELVDDEA